MNQVIIAKKKVEDPHCLIPNAILEDQSMSWKAKGILCYLLSGPPEDWMDRHEHSKNEERAVESGLRELLSSGYIKIETFKVRGEPQYSVLHVSDSPMYGMYANQTEVK